MPVNRGQRLVPVIVPVALLCDMFTHIGNTSKIGHFIGINAYSEGLLNIALQAHLVERIECQVGLYMIRQPHVALLLCSNKLRHSSLNRSKVLNRFEVFVPVSVPVNVNVPVTVPVNYLLQLKALQLVELSAGQVTVKDHNLHNLLIVLHSTVIWLDDAFLQQLLYRLAVNVNVNVRHNNSHELVADIGHGSLLHVGVELLQLELYLVGLHILTIRQHDDFLRPTGDIHSAFLIDAGQVAGMQEAILVYHLRRLFRAVIVTQHEVVALGTQFAIDNLHLHRRQRLARTARDIVAGTCEGDDGCRLGHAVTLKHIEAEGLQAIAYLAVEGCTARHAVVEVSAHLLPDTLEDEAAQGAVLQTIAYIK